MSEFPFVSIIITTCKREMDILERAIKSAVGQTYDNKEVIVVNDWPEYKERIEELIKRYPWVSFISNEKQSGACVSRNSAIEAAKGEFVALLDDDDEWLPEKLEKQVAAADDNTVLVYCDISAVKSGKELKSDPERKYPEGEVLGDILAANFVGGCSVPILRRKTILDCGGFDASFKSCQDIDLWIRMAKKGSFKAVKEKLVRYTVGEESITGSFERRMNGWEMILSKYRKEYENHPESRKVFTSTMVRESAKRSSLGYAFGVWKKYGNMWELFKGIVMKVMRIY